MSSTVIKVVILFVTVLFVNTSYAITVDDIMKDFVKIDAGKFLMGANGEANEKPIHTVYLDTYYISKYEVTFDQYDAFCDATGRSKPEDFKGWGRGSRPVINVTWNDSKAFCDWLSKKTGKNIHLPTEAQWEKACRAGSSEERYGNIDTIAWYKDNSSGKTHPVGQKQANGYGLYDMLGNVFEWCSDWYSYSYYSDSPVSNPAGPSNGSFGVIRGGSWLYSAGYVRAAHRGNIPKSFRSRYVGFRVAQD